MNETLLAISIGDIHWGAGDSEHRRKELTEEFLIPVQESELDLIVIDGDYWDTKLSLTDKNAIYGINFFTELYQICKAKNIKLRLLRGTYTHDFNQNETFRSFVDNDIFKIYNTVTEEEISGRKILFIPEEYPENMKDFYADYLNESRINYYDLIFGHGTFKFQAWQCQILESEKFIKSAPVFDEKEMMTYSKGPVLFGHIHISTSYKNKVFYHGSFSRTAHSEEQAKGFLLVEYKNENEYNVEFIENKLAPIYYALNIATFIKSNETFEDCIERLKGFVNKVYETAKSIRIELGSEYHNEKITEHNILRESFIDFPKVSFKINSFKTNTLTENDIKEISEQVVNEEVAQPEKEKNEFLEAYKNPSMAISKFIEKKFNKKITSEQIDELISLKKV